MSACVEARGSTVGAGYSAAPRGARGHGQSLHRWIVEQIEGPLFPGEVVRHTCDNPPCFLYEHLVRCTQAENLADMDAKGRRRSRRGGETACDAGHAFDDANTYITKSGKRQCRACRAARMRSRRA